MRGLASWHLAACMVPMLLACSTLTRFGDLELDREEDAGPVDGDDAGVGDAEPFEMGSDGAVAPPCARDADCDDADACTDDRCMEGHCTSSAIECADDDDDPCTRAHCSPEIGCDLVGVDEGAPCDDGSSCTRGERCVEGTCTAEETTECRTAVAPCEDSVCDPATGGCVARAREVGSACDDGDACTRATFCDADGACGGGETCAGDDDNPCTTHRCDPTDGCVDSPVADGVACGSGHACCGGTCVSLTTDSRHCGACDRACAAPSPSCMAGACATCSVSAPCPDDGLDCTGPPVCMPDGSCEHPIVLGACLIDGVCRTDGERDPSNDCRGCAGYAAPTRWVPLQDFGCDDGLFCTLGDTCEAGVCVGGAPIRCDDHNACTIEVCDEIADVCTTSTAPDGSSCAWRSACCAGTCQPAADGC